MQFVGRQGYLRWLDDEFNRVAGTQSRFLALRGRRQVGKSRLLTEWLRMRGHPHLYYQALNKPVDQELASFTAAVARSSLGSLPAVAAGGARWPSWEAALDAVASAGAGGPLGDGPAAVVIDELPYLINNDGSFEATLQAAWDHKLQSAGILLILVGSDLAMMQALTTYGRPLYNRVDTQRVVDPLNPAEVGDLLRVDATEALDTYLMTGGFPKVVAARAEHDGRREFLQAATLDEAHPLVYTGGQMLTAEFPSEASARSVLEAVGAGERAFGNIQARAGVVSATLSDTLKLLMQKSVVRRDDPWSARAIGKRSRYVVADPYLRFWLRFLTDRTDDISRGRGDLVAGDILASWQDYAGTAVEPIIREAIERILPDDRFGDARYVGSYWTRDHQTEVDLVGTKAAGKNDRIEFAGSVKWRARRFFGEDDVKELSDLAPQIPGWETTTRLVGVSRTGFTKGVHLDVELTPEELLEAWR
ncbi:MAG TPA: DUF234 domain-containing protein [Nitriliruptorales bacterium]